MVLVMQHQVHKGFATPLWNAPIRVELIPQHVLMDLESVVSVRICQQYHTTASSYQIPFKIFSLLSASKPKCNFGHCSKLTLKLSSYLLPKFSRVPQYVLISIISTMVNGTLLNFSKITRMTSGSFLNSGQSCTQVWMC